LKYGFKCADSIRASNVAIDIYPDPAKMNKQMKYANARQFEYALIIGDQEVNNKKLSVKNLKTGDQQSLSLLDTIELLKTIS